LAWVKRRLGSITIINRRKEADAAYGNQRLVGLSMGETVAKRRDAKERAYLEEEAWRI